MKSQVEIFWDAAAAKFDMPSNWNNLPRDVQLQVVNAINTITWALQKNYQSEQYKKQNEHNSQSA